MARAVVKKLAIDSLIYEIRGHKVMLDADLASLYGVETGQLNRAVKRNIDRFPVEFMFQLTGDEAQMLKCQNGISSGHGGRRRSLPYAFTEHGVLMAASILKSKKAIDVSIRIIEAFVRIKKMLVSYKDLARKVDAMEEKYDENFKAVFDALRSLIAPPYADHRKIGF